MSDQDSTRVVMEMFAAFGRGDEQGVLDKLTDDIEWRLAGPTEVAHAGVHRGKDEVAKLLKLLSQASEFEQFEVQDTIAQGEKVVVLGHERQRVKATGQVVDNDWAMVFTVRDGKIARFRNYEDTAAVAAAHRGR